MLTMRRLGNGMSPRTASRSAPPVGSSPTLVAPTTPVPGFPKAPARTHSDMAARWAEPPLRLRSMPQPTRSSGASAATRSSTKPVTSETSSPQTSAARSTVHSEQAARYSSTPSACSSTKARSTAPRRSQLGRRRHGQDDIGARQHGQEAGRPVGRRRAAGVDDHDLGPGPDPLLDAGGEVRVGDGRVGAPHHDEVAVGHVGRIGAGHATEDETPGLARRRGADGVLHLRRLQRLEQQRGETVALQHAARTSCRGTAPPSRGRSCRWPCGCGPRSRPGPRPNRWARTRPQPLGPTRRSGVVSRPSPWMRRVMRRTLRQIQPSVSGLAASPSGTASMRRDPVRRPR